MSTRTGTKTRSDALVGPDWLESRLGDAAVRVIEVDVSPKAYDEGHIPGAVLWNVYSDFRNSDYSLVAPDGFTALFARSGITPDATVVFYGYAPALAMWLMKAFGHRDARVLDYSRASWQADGRPWTAVVETPQPSVYPDSEPDARLRASASEVADSIGDGRTRIVDARTRLEYDGERFWPSGGSEPGGRAGHVPSAVNVAVDGIYNDDGSFKNETELRELVGEADPADDTGVITYCTVGGRAGTLWLVLTYLLHRPGVRVYDGSWAEWGLTAANPVE